MLARLSELLERIGPRTTSQVIYSDDLVKSRYKYHERLDTGSRYGYENSFMGRYKILWAKTFLSADDYTPPSTDHPTGTLYGKDIPEDFLNPKAEQDAEGISKPASGNPYSIKGQFKAFFGFPYQEQDGISGVRFLGFLGKVIPKSILNTFKLFTEFATGLAVEGCEIALSNTLYNFNFSNTTARKIGWGALIALSGLGLVLSSLVYFTGKAITSPMTNVVDTWNFFADMRARDEWYWRALGWTLGILGCLLSIAITAAAYTVLSTVAAGIGAFLLGAVGLGGTAVAIGLLAVEAAKLIGSIGFLSAFLPALAPTVTHLMGLAIGLLMPTVIAPIATAIDKAGSWLANKVANLGHRFVQWCKGDKAVNANPNLLLASEGIREDEPELITTQEQNISDNKRNSFDNTWLTQSLAATQTQIKPGPQPMPTVVSDNDVASVVAQPAPPVVSQAQQSVKKKNKNRGCNLFSCFSSPSKKDENKTKKDNNEDKTKKDLERQHEIERQRLKNDPTYIPPADGPVYRGL